MDDYKVVVDKFMVFVGMVDKVCFVVCVELDYCNFELEFDVVFNLEFLKEGVVINDFMKLDCIVVGIDSDKVFDLLCEVYYLFNCFYDCMIFMDVCLVELIKYVVNVMFVIKISFMNEVVNLVECLGVDIEVVC